MAQPKGGVVIIRLAGVVKAVVVQRSFECCAANLMSSRRLLDEVTSLVMTLEKATVSAIMVLCRPRP